MLMFSVHVNFTDRQTDNQIYFVCIPCNPGRPGSPWSPTSPGRPASPSSPNTNIENYRMPFLNISDLTWLETFSSRLFTESWSFVKKKAFLHCFQLMVSKKNQFQDFSTQFETFSNKKDIFNLYQICKACSEEYKRIEWRKKQNQALIVSIKRTSTNACWKLFYVVFQHNKFLFSKMYICIRIRNFHYVFQQHEKTACFY